ncbi:MAG: TIGR04086 family membrane protein [Oscillospiraceae bacterium]|nr:TIGR04086 family membrane protein [Oscillospiraceae bacterium]
MQRKSKPTSFRRFRLYITSAIVGGIASGVALVLFALLVFLLRLPIEQVALFSFIAFGIGCLVSGGFAGALKRQNGLVTGIKAAVVYAIPVAVMGLVLSGFVAPEVQPIPGVPPMPEPGVLQAFGEVLNKTVIAVLCGATGGVLGVNKNSGF